MKPKSSTDSFLLNHTIISQCCYIWKSATVTIKDNAVRQPDVRTIKTQPFHWEICEFNLKVFNLVNYQSFKYVKQLHETRVETRRCGSETSCKTLISRWGCSTARLIAELAAQIPAGLGAGAGCGVSPGSPAWRQGQPLPVIIQPWLPPCPAAHPVLRENQISTIQTDGFFFSWLAKESNFTKSEFVHHKETSPGYHVLI